MQIKITNMNHTKVKTKKKGRVYPKCPKCKMIIANSIIINRSNELQNRFCSGVPI